MLKKFLAGLLTVAAAGAMAAVDVNKASEADLDSLKGIGPSTSRQILSERKKGEFKDWDDLMHRVRGIGESKAKRLSAEGLTVNGHFFRDMSPAAVVPRQAAKPASAEKARNEGTKKESAPPSGGKS